ncbi:MAG: DUF234 domain-containing protein, partial [Pseudobdellovibrionaceae bacterium]
YSLEELANKLKYPSGGSLKGYLDNLEMAGFCRRYRDVFTHSRKGQKYKLVEPFLRFYYSQMSPHKGLIETNTDRDLYSQLVKPKISSWMGFAFENFCINNAELIGKKLGINNLITSFGSHFAKSDGIQFDLIYIRSDETLTVCEIKYYTDPVSSLVIREMKDKLKNFKVPRGFSVVKALITVNGADKAVVESGYFDSILTVEDFFI